MQLFVTVKVFNNIVVTALLSFWRPFLNLQAFQKGGLLVRGLKRIDGQRRSHFFSSELLPALIYKYSKIQCISWAQ